MTNMDRSADTLIIGGGVIGLCSAYYLLKQGQHVTILEQNEIGAGSSTGNAGHIVPSHIIPLAAPGVWRQGIKWMFDSNSPFTIAPRLDPNFLWWLLRFQMSCNDANVQRAIPVLKALGEASQQLFREIIEQEKLNCSYGEAGLLFLYRTQQAYDGGIAEGKLMQQHGVPVAILDRAAVHQVEPTAHDSVIGGVHLTGDSHLNPTQFLQEMTRLVQQAGATICTHTRVTGLEVQGGRIVAVQTEHERYRPKQVVLAAGAWSPVVARDLQLRLPVESGKGYSLTMPLPADAPSRPLLLAERRVALTPMGDKLRITGRLELSGIDTSVAPHKIDTIRYAVAEYLRSYSETQPVETWSGMRPTTPDGLPIIGRSARYENLILATGHAMIGVTLGPITGQLVAQIAAGQQPEIDIRGVRAERF